MRKIVYTLMSWDLFSEAEQADANQAMKLIQQISTPEDQKPMIRSFVVLIGTADAPASLRCGTAINICNLLNSRNLRFNFVEEPIELHMTMKPLYGVLLETCKSTTQPDESLIMECVYVLCVLLCLAEARCRNHIPGESVGRVRLS